MKVVDLLADRLHSPIHQLLQRFEQDLGQRIRNETDAERLDDWMDSRQALARRGHDFFPAFVHCLRQQCLDAYDHAPPVESTSPFRDRSQPLGLLDDEVVDEDSALAGLGARQESRASHPLMLLGHRFAVLLERPPLAASALPIGPHAMGRAIQHAAKTVGLKLHARLALYQAYEDDAAARFPLTMEAADAMLDASGVLTGLSYVPIRPKAVAHHPQRGAGQAAAPGLVAEIVAMRVVNETIDKLIPDGALPDHRLAERREAVAAMVRLVSRYGPESEQWQRCQGVMGEVVTAAAERRPARPGTAEWIRASLVELGYSEVECRRLSEALVHLGQDIALSRAAAAHDGRAPTRVRPPVPTVADPPVATGRRGEHVR